MKKILILFLLLNIGSCFEVNGVLFEPNVCTYSLEICHLSYRYDYFYVGNWCNCCNPVPGGAAGVDKYALIGVFCTGFWYHDYSFAVSASDAAYLYESGGGYCQNCV